MPAATIIPERIQNRMITVVSGHPAELEMMMQGCHAKDAPAEHPEREDLEYDGPGDEDVEATKQEEEKMGARE